MTRRTVTTALVLIAGFWSLGLLLTDQHVPAVYFLLLAWFVAWGDR